MDYNRITPMVREELSPEARDILDLWSNGRVEPKNIFKVYFKNEDLNNNWALMAGHLFFKNSLSSRQREIIVLRITWRCRSDYEFINHLEIVRDRKLMSEDEMLDLTRDVLQVEWSREEAALIAATNEISETMEISDATWAILAETLSEAQLMDAIVTVGGYTLNSMACNSLGVDIDPEHSRDAGLTPSVLGFTKQPAICTFNKVKMARLPPLSLESLDKTVRDLAKPIYDNVESKNTLMTLVRHPLLLKDWLPITRYCFEESNLNNADVDLIVLRTAWLCKAAYQFTHHAMLAPSRGLSAEHVDNVPTYETASVFNEKQRLLLEAVDQLIKWQMINDNLWSQLRGYYSELEMMDMVFTCGVFYMISIMQKSLRIQLEENIPTHHAFS